jgi:hypothetical protein
MVKMSHTTHTPFGLPFAAERSMTVGAELADARCRCFLSVEDLSAQTKIKIERIRAIEAMVWQQLPTLVYLKGFLHAYAAEVELDPDTVTARYLDELNEVAPEYAEREAHPPPAPEGPFLVRESIWDRDPDDDDFYAMDVMYPEPVFVPELKPPARAVPVTPRRRINRVAPAAFVGMVALVAGWAIGSYLHTITKPFMTAAVMRHAEGSATETDDARLDRARKRVAAAAAELAATPPVQASLLPPAPVPLPEPVAPTLDATKASAVDATHHASTLDVSGWWALTNRLESSAADTRDDLNFGFHLQLQQHGTHVTGTGVKWMENGRSIQTDSRIEIQVEGTVNARRLELNFTEQGTTTRRPGRFVMNLIDADTLRGRFVTAANARGVALGRRMESPPQ